MSSSSSKQTLDLGGAIALPLEMITMRTAVYGDSGAGKTTFARLLAEKVHAARHRFCAIDLKNDWWGLKSSADGSSAGIPVVVFGGPRADVRLIDDAAAARALAETVASIDQSVVLDLDAQSRAKQERFLTAFLDALYEANRRPLLLFCDEADRYAPQKPMSQDALMSLSSSEDIARRGRKRGIGSFWLTQRTAVLNKNVSEFANLTVVFRTPGEKDLKELEDRVGRITSKDVVREVMRLAPGLADGEAFFLSAHPKLRKFMPDPVRPVQLPLPWTFDSSATPGVGQRRREPKVLAETDLAAIEQRMAAQVEQARAEDPKHLRAEVARLKGELAKAQAKPDRPVVDERAADRRVKAAVEAAVRARDEDWETTFHVRFESLKANVVSAVNLAVEPRIKPPPIDWTRIGEARLAAEAAALPGYPVPANNDRIPRPARIELAPAARSVAPAANGDAAPARDVTARDQLGGAERRILDAAAWWLSMGEPDPGRDRLAIVAGYHPNTKGFVNALGALRSAGLMLGHQITHTGLALAQAPASPPTLAQVHERLKAVLSGTQAQIFDAVVSAGGRLPREQLAAAVGKHPNTKGFVNDLGRVRSLGIVDYDRGEVVATPLMFPKGLA